MEEVVLEMFAQYEKTLWKSLVMAFSVVMLSIATYGANATLLFLNFLYTFIISMISGIFVDVIYQIREKKKELKDGKH